VTLIARLAIRMLRREWRAGELKVLAAALIIAVASVSSVGFFTDRMERAMESGATELLGADLLLYSRTPIDKQVDVRARDLGLRVTRTVAFRSVVVVGEKLQLAEAKFVGEGYPLRGKLRVADVPFGADRLTAEIPAPGTAWTDARLASVLDVTLGDELELGAARFRVTRILAHEPDRGGDAFSIAPRVLVNLDDLRGTKLVQPGSRVRFKVLFAGPAQPLAQLRTWLEKRATAGEEIQGVREARPEIRTALQRAGQFLGLAALVAVLLSGVAVVLSARRYAQRHIDSAALLRCLGASQRTVLGIHALQLALLGTFACSIGVLIGWGVQSMLASLLASLMLTTLPAVSWLPALQGIAIGMSSLLGFALPPLIALQRVPPARVLRHEVGNASTHALPNTALAVLTVCALVLWQAKDLRLGAYVLAGGALTVTTLLAVSWLTVKLLGKLRSKVGVSWRFGIANVARRAGTSSVQVAGFGLGMAMLLVLSLVRTDLIGEWRSSLPENAPNYFLVNVQPSELQPLRDLLGDNGLAAADLYPMIRGRIIAINGRKARPEDMSNPRGANRVVRGFNLSYASRLNKDNRIVAGKFWPEQGPTKSEMSMEKGMADALGLRLNDNITFTVGGRMVEVTLTSLREVQWDSFNVNFFVITSPDVLRDIPATFVTSFHLPAQQRPTLLKLVRAFPTITIVDVDALLSKVREIMDRASTGIEYVFAFTLLAGLTVLFAAVQSTLDERRFETAILRTLGAARARVLKGLAAEFALIGVLAGTLACVAAVGIGAVLAQRVLQLSYHPSAFIWLVGSVGGAILVTVAGLLGTRQVIAQAPTITLRDG
jgi:putative ABC transport system permease protein